MSNTPSPNHAQNLAHLSHFYYALLSLAHLSHDRHSMLYLAWLWAIEQSLKMCGIFYYLYTLPIYRLSHV